MMLRKKDRTTVQTHQSVPHCMKKLTFNTSQNFCWLSSLLKSRHWIVLSLRNLQNEIKFRFMFDTKDDHSSTGSLLIRMARTGSIPPT